MSNYKSILKSIIKEAIDKLFEYDDEDYDLNEKIWTLKDELKNEIFEDFINREKFGYSRVPWRLIPLSLLQVTWNKFVEFGYVPDRYYKNLEKIEELMTENVLKLEILTELSGHTSFDPDEDFEEYRILGKEKEKDEYTIQISIVSDPNQLKLFKVPYTQFKVTLMDLDENAKDVKSAKSKESLKDILMSYSKKYRIKDVVSDNGFFDKYKADYISPEPNGYIEDFYDWTVDKDGIDIMSDYGLKPLMDLLYKLKTDKTPEEKLLTIDRMLNVVHQRSDLASWFVEGGSRALSQLSGMEEPQEN